ncbi:MAG: helix-turn-helix transcriptional regulator [Pikeienuella sp.]
MAAQPKVTETTEPLGRAAQDIAPNIATVDQAVANMQTLIADHVRSVRKRRGLPRRVLSEMSGVSQRYLAQLEAGQGNISIGLLTRVAFALDLPIEWLLSDGGSQTSEAQQVAELFSKADQPVKDSVLQALNAKPQLSTRANRICLIGLRGAGKSTLGEQAAQALGIPFVELSTEIEETGGMPVAEIMALYGNEGFRTLEREALNRVAEKHQTVLLAAAGGVVDEPETFQSLLSTYNTIWLKAAPQEHMDRVRAQGDERPMAGNPEAMQQLKTILKSRESLYAEAQVHLDTSGIDPATSLAQLLEIVTDYKFLS